MLWELFNTYPTKQEAQKAAAKIFINSRGVKIQLYNQTRFAVLYHNLVATNDHTNMHGETL